MFVTYEIIFAKGGGREKMTHKHQLRQSAWDIFFSLVLAVMFTVSPQFISTGKCILSLQEVVKIVLYFSVFIFSAALVRTFLVRFDFNISFFQNLLNHKHSILILALIIFLLWLPVLIILYPGTIINDTWGQLSQFVRTFYSDNTIHFEYLGDHHPVLTTFIMGWLIIPLANVLGNLQVALFIYVLLQALLTSLTFSYSLIYMSKRLGVGSGFTFICFLIYSLLPIFPGGVQTISKDALHAWIFAIFIISFLEALRMQGDSLDENYQVTVFTLVAWACCATKKVSFYVILISLVLLLLAVKKNRKKVLLICKR